jgi:RNA recognition motif-containing protein
MPAGLLEAIGGTPASVRLLIFSVAESFRVHCRAPESLAISPRTAMSTKLYAGNLPISATAELLAAKFAKFGSVVSVTLDRNSATGVSRRGAFVEMGNAADAARALAGLNLANFDGRLMSVYRAIVAVPSGVK